MTFIVNAVYACY